ncbi:hypothetical protein L6475_12100 [Prevotella sp. E9-3]|uniref:hypothetical protein n=1 Tax=Prevotella sp. E9-3 TaxID=2913621 RepID=UPI001EDA155D|nr:hypothetical protein [Prevotella sp. E9-3]UKK47941.1 hypothetical protein L6475_12100 [Prevotella sp. E9-3]
MYKYRYSSDTLLLQNFYDAAMVLQLYRNYHSAIMQPPFSCNTTTVQLQYSGHSVTVKNKCYFTIVVKSIPSYQ